MERYFTSFFQPNGKKFFEGDLRIKYTNKNYGYPSVIYIHFDWIQSKLNIKISLSDNRCASELVHNQASSSSLVDGYLLDSQSGSSISWNVIYALQQ